MNEWRRYDENDSATFPPEGRIVLLAFYSSWSTSPAQKSPWYIGIGVAEKDGKLRLDAYDKLFLRAWMLLPDPPKEIEVSQSTSSRARFAEGKSVSTLET